MRDKGRDARAIITRRKGDREQRHRQRELEKDIEAEMEKERYKNQNEREARDRDKKEKRDGERQKERERDLVSLFCSFSPSLLSLATVPLMTAAGAHEQRDHVFAAYDMRFGLDMPSTTGSR